MPIEMNPVVTIFCRSLIPEPFITQPSLPASTYSTFTLSYYPETYLMDLRNAIPNVYNFCSLSITLSISNVYPCKSYRHSHFLHMTCRKTEKGKCEKSYIFLVSAISLLEKASEMSKWMLIMKDIKTQRLSQSVHSFVTNSPFLLGFRKDSIIP